MTGWDQRYDVDAWNTDVLEDARTCVDLPRSLAELRDGIAPPAPNQGAARQRRITQMQADIAWCQDFVADCDRWADSVKGHNPCVTTTVPLMVRRFVADERAKAVATGRRIRDELAVLRGTT